MKKKFIAVSVLICALALGSTTLTSCVDDNESASVTAIRDAKAQQLASIAALNNAQAKAQELRAQAEADLAAANAAYQQALADQEASKADFLAEKYKAKLEALKAQYEAQIMEAKKDAADYEQQLWDKLDTHLGDLYTSYTTALGKVETLNKDIFDAQFDLANVDVNQEAADAAAKEQINSINTQITYKTAQIERLKTQVGDKDALFKQMNDLADQAYKLINTDKPAAEEARDAANEAYDEAYAPIDYTKVNATWTDEHAKLEWEKTALDYIFAVDTLKQIETEGSLANKLIQRVNEKVENAVEGCYITGNVGTWVLTEGSEYLQATQQAVNYLNQQITNAQTILGKATDAADVNGSLYAKQKAAEEAKKAADVALAADPTNPSLKSQAEQTAVSLMQAQEAVTGGIETLTNAQNKLKSYNNAIAAVTKDSEQQKAYVAAVAKAVEAKKDLQAKKHEVHVINTAISAIGINSFNNKGKVVTGFDPDGEYGIAQALYTGTTTAESAITKLEKEIAELKQDLTEVGADGKWENTTIRVWDSSIGGWVMTAGQQWVVTSKLTADQTKKLIQLKIDRLTAELEIQNKLVAQYKAALENAIQNMNNEDIEVPETPAEGEETPAE
ncbi:hypothetical protein [Phocaeicola coprophilus]|uniref:hypothetical protein n=1 Tax=Phocaeicola coprophilus TaxID=387090 RepID=UPI00266D046A|nr:hypothetical protein [Phocaeicola coprophilus]